MIADVPVLGLIIWGAVYIGAVGFYGSIIRASDRALDAVIRRLNG